jgi:hypothetical protein
VFWASQWPLSLWLSHQYPICIPLLPHWCYMACPSYLLSLDHSNYTWWRLQVMKFLIMQFYPTSSHLISLRSKYSPQHPVLRHPQSMFLLQQLRFPLHTTVTL